MRLTIDGYCGEKQASGEYGLRLFFRGRGGGYVLFVLGWGLVRTPGMEGGPFGRGGLGRCGVCGCGGSEEGVWCLGESLGGSKTSRLHLEGVKCS